MKHSIYVFTQNELNRKQQFPNMLVCKEVFVSLQFNLQFIEWILKK